MVHTLILKTRFILFGTVISLLLGLGSCANRTSGPTGGPKDSIPPRVILSKPENTSLQFKEKKIEIDFDEIILLEKVADNVMVSPPQKKAPDIKAIGKKLRIEFEDSLEDNTTYSIDFGNAIVDNNEKNPLPNYRFSFSTGSVIDTLQIAGSVINAQDLNPISGLIVGVYPNVQDSVFYSKPFLRVAKTDEKGAFLISNLKGGTYKLFALQDDNRDYFFQPGEGLAMLDSLVLPTVSKVQKSDTVWKDSVHVDSIRSTMITKYAPDNILLRFFKEERQRQFFVKSERKEAQSFSLIFNTKNEQMPTVRPLNFDWEGKYLVQKNKDLDSLTYWITDSTLWKMDSLEVELTYKMTDSLYRLVPQTDTLTLVMRKVVNPKAQKKAVKAKESFIFTHSLSRVLDVYSPLILNFEKPVDSIQWAMVKLYEKKDSILIPVPLGWTQLDSVGLSYGALCKWKPETNYRFRIDSAAFRSIYGVVNDSLDFSFGVKSLDEYASLKVKIEPFDARAVLQLLDAKDAVVATKATKADLTVFEYLKPGDYYLRMFIDLNGDMLWDTGDLALGRQPEEVFYHSKKMTLLPNWEFEELWDVKLPLLQQKPQPLRKDAAKAKK